MGHAANLEDLVTQLTPTAYVVNIVDAARRLGGRVRASIEDSGYEGTGCYGTPGYHGEGMSYPMPLDERFLVFHVEFPEPVFESELADEMPIDNRRFTRAHGAHKGTKLDGMTVWWHPQLTDRLGDRGMGICVAVGNYRSGLSASPGGIDQRGCAHYTVCADGTLRDGLFG